MFFFQTVCAQVELTIPTTSVCLPSQFWNTSSVLFFFQGGNFPCSFMAPDYWFNSVMQYLNPSIRTGLSTRRSTENSTLWNSSYVFACEEWEILILWNQQGKEVKSTQLPLVSLLFFISPSLYVFQIIAYLSCHNVNLKLLGSKLASLFEFVHRFGYSQKQWEEYSLGNLEKLCH